MPRKPDPNIQRLFVVATITTLLALLTPTLFAARAASARSRSAGPPGQETDAQAKTVLHANDVDARIVLSNSRASGGQRLGVVVDFDVAPGWHIYGKPLPEEYTPTTVTFDPDLLAAQKLDFPKAKPVKFELLDETLPVYQGHFEAAGDIVLRRQLKPGEHRLGGTLSFQECNDSLCKEPQQVRFDIPLQIDLSPMAAPG